MQGLSARELLYEVKQPLTAADQPFALTVTRKASGQPVFSTEGHRWGRLTWKHQQQERLHSTCSRHTGHLLAGSS